MSRKIIGVTVGTPLSPAKIEEKIKPVKTVNGVSPDASGNVEVKVGVSDDDIREAFETALQQAKDSGEFDGEDGADGVSVTHSWVGTKLVVTSASGTSSADLKGEKGNTGEAGYTPKKGVDYFDGKDGATGAAGKDGTSATHSWRGTVLTITSASGTSSADLKGEKGNTGDTGYTPIKGTDYFDGEDGVSPTVSVTPITGGNRVSITDANGAKTFDVMNGKDGAAGAGSGDMLASMYDPQGKRLDIFAYVDEKTKDIDVDVTADEVTFADGETFQQKYDNGELRGPIGTTGAQGEPGVPGKDGYTPVKGVDYFDGSPGNPGKDGLDGDDGVGIQSVVQTTTSNADGGTNIITVTKTDGGTSTFSVKNGSKGSDGAAGKDGRDGQDGSPGKTPVKGTDYWTAADKQEIVAAVLTALPAAEEASF